MVSWISRKQSTLDQSSTEVEYRAVATTTQELEAVRLMLFELEVEVPKPMVILTDNLGAMFIAKNPIGHSKLKHVALDLHFVREKTKSSEIIVKHVSGKKQWADVLTKPLPSKAFEMLQSKLVREVPQA